MSHVGECDWYSWIWRSVSWIALKTVVVGRNPLHSGWRMACCVEPNFSYEGDEDGYSIAMTAASDDDSSEASDRSRKAIVHRPTPLFREIEQLNWEYVLLFLKTSKWANSFFTTSSTEHLAHSDAATQARTWVMDRGDVRRLPIHLAVSLNAPFVVLQKLLETYPESIRMRDSQGLLPLHIAYKTEVPDTVISTLLEAWPASSLEKNKEGQLPHEEPGETVRGKILSLTLTQMAAQVKTDRDKEWRQFIATEADTIALEVTQDTTLMLVMKQLVEDRKQLMEIKSQLKTNFSAASSRGTGSSSEIKSSSKHSKESTPGRIESAFAKHMSRRGRKGRKGGKNNQSKTDADLETIFSGATEPQKNPRSPHVL